MKRCYTNKFIIIAVLIIIISVLDHPSETIENSYNRHYQLHTSLIRTHISAAHISHQDTYLSCKHLSVRESNNAAHVPTRALKHSTVVSNIRFNLILFLIQIQPCSVSYSKHAKQNNGSPNVYQQQTYANTEPKEAHLTTLAYKFTNLVQ